MKQFLNRVMLFVFVMLFSFSISSVFAQTPTRFFRVPSFSQLRKTNPPELPFWIEEGIAKHNNNPEKMKKISEDLIRFWSSTNIWPELSQVASSKHLMEYNTSSPRWKEYLSLDFQKYFPVQYIMSVSLADYLLTRGDKQTLQSFGQDLRKNIKDHNLITDYDERLRAWAEPLQKYYNIKDFEQLERGWQDFVINQQPKLIKVVVQPQTNQKSQEKWDETRRQAEVLFNQLSIGINKETKKVGYSYDENFIIMSETQELTDTLLSRAEDWRKKIAQDVFGSQLAKIGLKEFPAGAGKCVVHMDTLTPENSGLTWRIDFEERTMHKMWITCGKEPATADSTLGHEMVHAMLATFYGDKVPSWAEEGIASHYDDFGRIIIRQQIVNNWVNSGTWPSLTKLLDSESLSSTDQDLYTMAIYLNDYLLTKGSMETFLNFSIDGKKDGWPEALKKRYGIKSVDQLQKEWRNYILSLTKP